MENHWQRAAWTDQILHPISPSTQTILKLQCHVGHTYWESQCSPFVQISAHTGEETLVIVVNEDWPPAKLTNLRKELSSLLTLNDLAVTMLQHSPQAKSFRYNHRCALELVPVTIPKPWGQEVWYSGTEKRGVCGVKCADDKSLPLPHFEISANLALTRAESALILLKELHPYDTEFYGELYTELHFQKSEVYIVSEIGQTAPAEVRLGLQKKVNLESLQKILLEYERVRSQIDRALESAGFDFNPNGKPRSPKEICEAKKNLLPSAETSLLTRERDLHQKVRTFFSHHSLNLGDVVSVPTQTPHALQPGVQVVEFQTPHYERLILSSNQKVLTQESWDVQQAIATLQKHPDISSPDSKAILRAFPAKCQIVDFPNMQVERLALNSTSHPIFHLPSQPTARVCFLLNGDVILNSLTQGNHPSKKQELTGRRSRAWVLPQNALELHLPSTNSCATLLVGNMKLSESSFRKITACSESERCESQ